MGAAQRAGSVFQLQVSFDREALAHEAAEQRRETELHRTGLDHLARLPTEWRGKRYRRRERTANEHERAEAYRKERDREGQQVMALLLEANLPFAKTLERVGPDDAAAQRCCLGMQPKSLRQRLACRRPVREFLLHAHRDVFPRSADAFLDYFAHLRKGGAAKTSCKSAQLSHAFLEEAGEVGSASRLSAFPSVANFVKEAKLAAEVEEARARETSAWRPLSTDQAPQLLLRLVGGFEAVVADAERPLYQRAFAWYRLLRHWASLRWDDTQGIQPSRFDRRARGLFAAFEKSKTSRPGKRTKVIPV